jgi:hypothetical protein
MEMWPKGRLYRQNFLPTATYALTPGQYLIIHG